MNIEVHTSGVKSDEKVRQFIDKKINATLDRFQGRIEQVIIKLEDESRGSKAFDGKCRIDARLSPNGNIHITAHGNSPEETVAQAVSKLEQAIVNEIDRHRSSSRIRHEKSKREFIASLETPNEEP